MTTDKAMLSGILFPTIWPKTGSDVLWNVVPYLGTALCAGLLGLVLATCFRQRYGGQRSLLFILLPAAFTVLAQLRFGFGAELLRGVVLCLTLLYASGADIRTREVPDCLSVTIAVAALIGRTPAELPVLLLEAVLITLPQLAIAVLKPNSYGGADIKIMAACAFLLGFGKGLTAIILGLLLAVVCTVIIRKIKRRSMKESFALVPYLSVGSMLAFLL